MGCFNGRDWLFGSCKATRETKGIRAAGGKMRKIAQMAILGIFLFLLNVGFANQCQAIDVYVSTYFENGEIIKVDSETGAKEVIASDLEYPEDMALDENGILYIGGVYKDGVRRVDTKAKIILPDTGTNICAPEGPSIDADGNIYFNTRRIRGQIWDPGDICRHTGIWKLTDGEDMEAEQVVLPFSSFGEGTAILTSGPYAGDIIASAKPERKVVKSSHPDFGTAEDFITGFGSEIFGLAVDSLSNIYVAERDAGVIWKFSSDGSSGEIYYDELNCPAFLEFDSNDNLYITESNEVSSACEGITAGLVKIDPELNKTNIANINGALGIALSKKPSPPSEPKIPVLVVPGFLNSWSTKLFNGGQYIANRTAEEILIPYMVDKPYISLSQASKFHINNNWGVLYILKPLFDELKFQGYYGAIDNKWNSDINRWEISSGNIFIAPYNWMQSNSDSYKNFLIKQIDEAKRINGLGPDDQIDIVAYSNGGLVVRAYIQSNDYRHDIRKLAMVGVPNKGSVFAYDIWEAGEVRNSSYLKLLLTELMLDLIKKSWGKLLLHDMYFIQESILSIKDVIPTFKFLLMKEPPVVKSGAIKHNNNNGWLRFKGIISLDSDESINLTSEDFIFRIEDGSGTLYEMNIPAGNFKKKIKRRKTSYSYSDIWLISQPDLKDISFTTKNNKKFKWEVIVANANINKPAEDKIVTSLVIGDDEFSGVNSYRYNKKGTKLTLRKQKARKGYHKIGRKNENTSLKLLNKKINKLINSGVDIKIFAGTGLNTLSTLIVKPGPKVNLLTGIYTYPDGIPKDEVYLDSGDGTVLVYSASIKEIPLQTATGVDHSDLIFDFTDDIAQFLSQ